MSEILSGPAKEMFDLLQDTLIKLNAIDVPAFRGKEHTRHIQFLVDKYAPQPNMPPFLVTQFSDLTIMAFKRLLENNRDVSKLETDEKIRLRQHGLICPNTEVKDGGEVLTFIGANLEILLHGLKELVTK